MSSPTGTAELLIEIATAEVGYIEEAVPENKTKYQKANQPWCGAFVNWCGKKAGVEIPNTVYTPAGADAFKKMNEDINKMIKRYSVKVKSIRPEY